MGKKKRRKKRILKVLLVSTTTSNVSNASAPQRIYQSIHRPDCRSLDDLKSAHPTKDQSHPLKKTLKTYLLFSARVAPSSFSCLLFLGTAFKETLFPPFNSVEPAAFIFPGCIFLISSFSFKLLGCDLWDLLTDLPFPSKGSHSWKNYKERALNFILGLLYRSIPTNR